MILPKFDCSGARESQVPVPYEEEDQNAEKGHVQDQKEVQIVVEFCLIRQEQQLDEYSKREMQESKALT